MIQNGVAGYNSPRILGSDSADELVLVYRKAQSVAVVALRFNSFVVPTKTTARSDFSAAAEALAMEPGMSTCSKIRKAEP
jgi:hypothetical protein